MFNREKAFTLIELLIVIAIIAILTVAFLPTLRGGTVSARDAGRKAEVKKIVDAIEQIVNGDLPDVSAAIPTGIAGICLDFKGSLTDTLPAKKIGAAIKQMMGKIPQFYPQNVTLCSGGYFYKSYVADGSTASGSPQTNYIVVVQVEDIKNANTYYPGSITWTANSISGAPFNNFKTVLTSTAGSGTPTNPFWVITK